MLSTRYVVKFSNEVMEKDSVLGGVFSGLSIRPDAQENLILLLALLITQPQLKAIHESRSLRTLCSTKSLIKLSAQRVDEILADEADPLSLPCQQPSRLARTC